LAVNPRAVISPQDRLDQLRVIHIHPNWSLAIGLWDGDRALLTRWNGDAQRPLGNPVSHSYPTWFVVPAEFQNAASPQNGKTQRPDLLEPMNLHFTVRHYPNRWGSYH
jgi:hypothetical protein